MAHEENIRGKRLKALLADLGSKDSEKQMAAVQGMKTHGNETIIEPLIQTLCASKSEQLKQEIVDVLNNVKSSKVCEKIILCLGSKKYVGCRQELLASIWNSGLDYREYLTEIIMAGVDGDLMEALECVTIVENFEGIPSEEVLNESLVVLGNYLSDHKNESSPKMDLLIQIGILLKRMNDAN